MKLWILRHAQAEEHSLSGRDRDRPLSPAGRHCCRELNQWIKRCHLSLPERILVSPAERTRETVRRVLADFEMTAPEFPEALWQASPGTLVDVINEAGETEPESLMLIGHNPGLEALVTFLGGQLPVTGLKPGTLIILDVAVPLGTGPTTTDQLVPASDST